MTIVYTDGTTLVHLERRIEGAGYAALLASLLTGVKPLRYLSPFLGT